MLKGDWPSGQFVGITAAVLATLVVIGQVFRVFRSIQRVAKGDDSPAPAGFASLESNGIILVILPPLVIGLICEVLKNVLNFVNS